MKYNHDRPLEDFENNLKFLHKAGFNPIAVTQMYFEDTYVFKTKKEANRAYKQFEKDLQFKKNSKNKKKRIVGWWYGKKDFLDEVKRYETDNNGYSKVKVYWLDKEGEN